MKNILRSCRERLSSLRYHMSFRVRVFLSALLASLIPLLLCSAIIIETVQSELTDSEIEYAVSSSGHLSQILDQYCDTVEDALDSLQENEAVQKLLVSPNSAVRLSAYSALSSAFSDYRQYLSIGLYTADGLLLTSAEDSGTLSSADLKAQLQETGSQAAVRFLAKDRNASDSLPVFRFIAACPDRSGAASGYLVAETNEIQLKRLLSNNYAYKEIIQVYDDGWNTLLDLSDGKLPFSASDAQALSSESGKLRIAGETCFYSFSRSESTGLMCLYLFPSVENAAVRKTIVLTVLGSLLAGILICFWLSYYISCRLYAPVRDLEQAFSHLERNDLSVRVFPDRGDELGRLGAHFNSMIDTLQKNQTALVENEKELKDTQIRMLQAQLNPHFMCNTLDTMKWISKINRVPEVAIMSTDLAEILRFSISQEEYVTFGKVLSMLDRYMEIQRIRMSERFSYEVTVPEEAKECLMPKMTLQPILENSVIHGVDNRDNGRITLTAEISDGILCIRIQDNGPGFPEEMLGFYQRTSTKTDRHHLGMYNVNTILRNNYGENSGLYLSNSETETGACVTVRLPARYQKSEDEKE